MTSAAEKRLAEELKRVKAHLAEKDRQVESLKKHVRELSQDKSLYGSLIHNLRTSEKKFRTILDTATDAILSIDEEQRIVFFNNAAEKTFGYPREEVLGENLNLLIPPGYGDNYRYGRDFLKTGQPGVIGQSLPLSAIRKGGEEFPIELALSYLKMHGETTFTAIIRDMSRQKQLERKLLQSERLAAVGRAVAHVAHELKNPLMIIGGFSNQIRKSLTDQKALQKLDMIADEVKRLEKLVSSLSDITREYRLVKRLADINAVVTDVIKTFEQIYPGRKYSFLPELDYNLGEIRCDPDKLKQVFINVITNSIEAMQDGGKIKISTGRRAGRVDICVRDEGPGIPEGDLLNIFEQFYTTRKRGSGLGLSISYKIVEAHGGEIWAISKLNRGSSFFIRLPEE